MLKYRLITTSILMPVVIIVVFWLPLIIFISVMLMVCMLSAWEWGAFIGLTKYYQRIWLTSLCGLLLASTLFHVPTYIPFMDNRQVQYILWAAMIWWFTAIPLLLYYPHSAILWRKSRVLKLIFGILTIFPFFWGVLTLRQYNYNINHLTGAWWLLYIMIVVWSADSGAYIFGRILGRHKLAPQVSPGKTWEGLVGGLILAIVIPWIYSKYTPLGTTPLTLLGHSIVTTITSLLGDLTESMFKREAGIKNSSQLIPGHGGILDRIDSLTATIPIFVCLNTTDLSHYFF